MFLKHSIALMVLLGATGQLIAAEPAQPWKGEV